MPKKPNFTKNRRFNNKKPWTRRPHAREDSTREYQHQNQLRELDVGITQFISPLEGFSGVIKARFSDFQVNEIDLNGQVAKLTDTSIPKDFIKKEEAPVEVPDNSPLTVIPQETWEAIKAMIGNPNLTNNVEFDITELTKEDRAKIHECVCKTFPRKVQTKTIERDGKKVIEVKKSGGKADRFKWPEDKGEYVHFLVYKECLDTLETTLKIASCLRIPSSCIAYAGVKDRRGKTTQWFSIRKIEPWKLIIKTKGLRNVKIGNITFKDEPLKLGHLSGNKFRIALRNVSGADDLIEKSLQSLSTNGFINYYGLQRFGNDKECPTFSPGIQLLLGNWKEACQMILKPTNSDNPTSDLSKAKKVYMETGDAAKALKAFEEPNKSCIEYLLLEALSKGHANDFVNALSSIPRNTRLLYIHSFQSLVWNQAASERIEKYGLKVAIGDLVLLEEPNQTEEKENEEDATDQQKIKVKSITADDLDKYTIYDIVLPLPGYDITYPDNLTDCYKEILEKHGLSLEMTKQKVETYTLSGTYRKLLGQVHELSWKIMHYNDPNYNLIRSDFEQLKGEGEPKDIENGKYKALVLEFTLDPSSYATMVLREILKIDTSSSLHAKLNDYHRVETTGSTIEEPEIPDDKVGLLGDAQKYEEFKKLIFENPEQGTKRQGGGDELGSSPKSAKIE